MRLDQTGAVLWQSTFEPPGSPSFFGTSFEKVRRTTGGDLVALGSTSHTSFGGGAWAVKVSDSGTLIWQQSWESFGPFDFVLASDGGFVAAGVTGGGLARDGAVARLDPSGVVQWQRSYGGAENDELEAIVATADGGYLVAGYTRSFGASQVDNEDVWALKLDGDGNVQWERRYDSGEDERTLAAARTPDGGFVLAGYATISGVKHGSLLRIDAAGNLVWHKVSGPSPTVSTFPAVAVLGDGAIVVTEQKQAGGAEDHLLKLSANGVPIWSANVVAGNGLRVASDGILVSDWDRASISPKLWVQKVALNGRLCGPPANLTVEDRATTDAATTATAASQTVLSEATSNVKSQTSGVNSTVVCSTTAIDTLGLYDPSASVFHLRTELAGGPADSEIPFGPAGSGWTPLAGDWNGDGTDTIGLYDPSRALFFLRNSNSTGDADIMFAYGPPGAPWTPVVGDWDGDGDDTIGLFDPATSAWYLRNSNDTGYADVTFSYGPGGAGWLPVTGRWSNAPGSVVGLYDPGDSAFYLPAQNGDPYASVAFGYGPAGAGWLPVPGDWNADEISTPGLFDPTRALWFLRNSNDGGFADLTVAYGPPGAGFIPLAGDWDGH